MNLRRLSSKSVLYILLFYTAVLLNQIYVRSQFPFSSGIIRDLVCPNFSLVSGLDSYTPCSFSFLFSPGSVSYSLQVKFPILLRFSFLFSPGLVSNSLQVKFPILSSITFLILSRLSFLFSPGLISFSLQFLFTILSRFSFLFSLGSVFYSLQV